MYGMILDAWYGAMQRVHKNIRVLNYNFIIIYVVRELIINKTLLRVSDVYFLPVREYDLSKYMYDVCSSVYEIYSTTNRALRAAGRPDECSYYNYAESNLVCAMCWYNVLASQ